MYKAKVDATSKKAKAEAALKNAKAIWKKVDAVIFDVDATLIQELSLNELAFFCGKGEEFQQMADSVTSAMMPYLDALEKAMDTINPTRSLLEDFNRGNLLTISPRIKELIQALKRKEVQIYVVGSTFDCLISNILDQLFVPPKNVFVNRIRFYCDGSYAGFEKTGPAAYPSGKAMVAQILKDKYGYQNLVNIGDGYTDAEASPPSDLFIGYGGSVVRTHIKNIAPWYITDFQDLIDNLY